MKLFLECNPDGVLARVAGVPQRAIIHSHGKGRVSKQLGKLTGVSGLVDEDPGSAEPRTLSGFAEVSRSHDVKLKIDKTRNNRLIVLCPKLEDWVIKSAKSAELKMESFNLSDRPGELHASINQRLPNLERLLTELANLQNPRLLCLRSLLLGS